MIRYIIIRGETYPELMRLVNERIDEGYAPIGGVAISDGRYYQAMYKE